MKSYLLLVFIGMFMLASCQSDEEVPEVPDGPTEAGAEAPQARATLDFRADPLDTGLSPAQDSALNTPVDVSALLADSNEHTIWSCGNVTWTLIEDPKGPRTCELYRNPKFPNQKEEYVYGAVWTPGFCRDKMEDVYIDQHATQGVTCTVIKSAGN